MSAAPRTKPTPPAIHPAITPPRVNGAPRPTGAARAKPPLDDLLAAADAAFDAVVDPTPLPHAPAPVFDATSKLEVTKLFAEIGAVYAGQVRELAMELALGEADKQWAAICRPAIASLIKAGREMELGDLLAGLERFDAVLARVLGNPSSKIAGKLRDELLDRYAELTKVMPAIFAITEERDRRESVIVQALLRQVEGVSTPVIDRLYAAGVHSLEALYAASAEDLADVAAISPERARGIVERVRAYRIERGNTVPDGEGAERRVRLQSVLRRLQERHREFRVAEETEDLPRKRKARRDRTAAMHDLQLTLAQLGEVDLIRELERAPIDRKIERVSLYLAAPNNRAVAPA